MDYVQVTKDNIETEHICCAISSNKDVQVFSKKKWLSERFEDGLVFYRSAERGKCFIEYIPAENAWVPIIAPGWLYIDCLWVSGALKGKGHSTNLLNRCIDDALRSRKHGLCILSSARKRPFLADPKFLSYKGFEVCDESDNGVQLWFLSLDNSLERPRFRECARHPSVPDQGFVLYYTDQCPFTAKYVPLVKELADSRCVPFKAIHITSCEEAQNAPTPVTNYALFRDGEYVSNEILSEKKFLTLIG